MAGLSDFKVFKVLKVFRVFRVLKERARRRGVGLADYFAERDYSIVQV